ncbi:MAG: M24 family metallopeptidase, partial [Chromatiales bacterium]|nr:M24 family metallopeptidase [Chromatiales bacterium]
MVHFSTFLDDVRPYADGTKSPLAFSAGEYERHLSQLRSMIDAQSLDAVVLTSIHNVAYYCGFLYCSFGRPCACVVTASECVTVSANIDGGQPWRRSVSGNVIYSDWQRGNFLCAVKGVASCATCIGVEFDHLSVSMHRQLECSFAGVRIVDVATETMAQRMIKSDEEIFLIEAGAQIADIGGVAAREAVKEGVAEFEVAHEATGAMHAEIARRFPDSEIRDSWTWFQSGPNTDGAHNPLTSRALEMGDVLSLNTFPMISGYYTALERTLFLGEPDRVSRRYREVSVGAHELGCSLIRPGAVCSDICVEINEYFAQHKVLRYRAFGYGHSFGLLSHYYGREAAIELREDVDTLL